MIMERGLEAIVKCLLIKSQFCLMIKLGNIFFFHLTVKAKATKTINEWDYITLKICLTARETTNKMKRQHKEWMKIFARS